MIFAPKKKKRVENEKNSSFGGLVHNNSLCLVKGEGASTDWQYYFKRGRLLREGRENYQHQLPAKNLGGR